MAISSDIQNIIEVISLTNLANLAQPVPTLTIPAGLTSLYLTTIQNNLAANLFLAPDIQQVVKTLVTNGEVTIVET